MTTYRIAWPLTLVLLAAACGAPDNDTEPAVARTAVEPADTCELTVGWDPWPPYQYADVDGAVRGMDIEIMQAVASEAGCEIALVSGDWSELLVRLRQGETDVLLASTPTDSRQNYAHFSSPYREERFVRFAAADAADALSGQSLRQLAEAGHDIGLTQGFYYGEEVGELAYESELAERFVASPYAELGLWRLRDRTVDVLIADPIVAAAFFRRKGWQDEFVELPGNIRSDVVSIMFSRKSVEPSVVERIDAAIATLKANGRLQAIIDKYRGA